MHIAVLMVCPASGQEVAAPNLREKLRARIVETLPPPSSDRPDDKPEQPTPVLVLEPMVVSEFRGVRELEKVLAGDKQRKETERFSVTKGGTLYRSDRVELGSWWSPTTGWQFLKLKW